MFDTFYYIKYNKLCYTYGLFNITKITNYFVISKFILHIFPSGTNIPMMVNIYLILFIPKVKLINNQINNIIVIFDPFTYTYDKFFSSTM